MAEGGRRGRGKARRMAGASVQLTSYFHFSVTFCDKDDEGDWCRINTSNSRELSDPEPLDMYSPALFCFVEVLFLACGFLPLSSVVGSCT